MFCFRKGNKMKMLNIPKRDTLTVLFLLHLRSGIFINYFAIMPVRYYGIKTNLAKQNCKLNPHSYNR